MINTTIPYIIGETAFHHEGDVSFLKELIKEAITLKLDAIKFHITIDINDYMITDHDAIEVLRPWCLSKEDWLDIFSFCKNIDIICLCNDLASLQFINSIQNKNNIVAVELHATGLNDIFLLEESIKFKQCIILGTGGSTLDEIDYAIQFLKNNNKYHILLMHGFQNYPTNYNDVKLDRMKKLNNLFDLPVGYADHTDPADSLNTTISCLGVANGFNVLEKHFTHVFGEKRIDAQAAVSLSKMEEVKALSQTIFKILGANNPILFSNAELKYGNTGPMKKAIVARQAIKKGETITKNNIAFKRTNSSSSLKQNELFKILNNVAIKNIDKDEILNLSNIEYTFVSADVSQFKNTNK
jgi:sialic acid synthase SpsE